MTGPVGGYAFEFRGVTKRFKHTVALDRVDLAVPAGAVVGLIGRNGSGKSTLLRHVVGLYLPSEGACVTLGQAAAALDAGTLARIGVVQQEADFIPWMRVGQQLRYLSSFYDRWDRVLEDRLVRDLELDRTARIGTLPPGNLQKLALVLAFCHHPDLVLLDEPVSALDPLAREAMLRFLLEVARTDGPTLVVSSHVLRDVERVVDRVICLEQGRVTEHAELDELLERWAEWKVTAHHGTLPQHLPEPWVVQQEGAGREARLLVRDAAGELQAFRSAYRAEVEVRPVTLERLFPRLIGRP